MGLIHTPRVLLACGRGKIQFTVIAAGNNGTEPGSTLSFLSHSLTIFQWHLCLPHCQTGMIRRALKKDGSTTLPIGWENHHSLTARVGLFDFDYAGHMNNAAFLSHVEMARWEMSAETGILQSVASKNVFMYITGSFIRYRKEIRPIFRSFTIETYVSAVDENSLWFSHNLRYSPKDRICAQILIKSSLMHKGKAIDPRDFLVNDLKCDEELVQKIARNNGELVPHPELLDSYDDLDNTMRKIAAADDARLQNK